MKPTALAARLFALISAGTCFLLSLPTANAAAGPEIIGQPASRGVLQGSNTFFRVISNGQEPLSYYWLLNGTRISNSDRVSGATTETLSIVNAQTSDAGNYQVIVSNRHGIATSVIATLAVFTRPSISLHPTSTNRVVGTDVSLWVQASGTSPLQYRWRKSGADLAESGKYSGTGTPMLTVTALQSGDEGIYDVVVTNPYGAATSTVAQVSVLFPPSIAAHPGHVSVFYQSNALFVVSATGTAPLFFQWRKDGEPVTNNARITGTTSNWLQLTGITQEDTGVYDVVVTNLYGLAVSDDAVLTVLMPPTITRQPTNTIVPVGTDAELSVAASGTGALSYRWQRNGINLTDDGRVIGTQTPTLRIMAAQPGDSGNYRVLVTEYGTTISATAGLTVVHPPQLSTVPSRVGYWNGATTFSVLVSGTGPFAYQWQRNGTNLTDDSRILGATTSLLRISATQVSDEADYRVVVANAWISVTSSVARLAVVPVVAWGDNSVGQTSIPPSATNIVAISSGQQHSLALRADGTLVAWGNNSYGQLNIPPSATNIVAIAAGYYHNLAIRSNGTVLAWGENANGQATVPANVLQAIAVAGSDHHSMALLRSGRIVIWGANSFGETNPPPSATNLVGIDAGIYHTIGLRADGVVFGWGNNQAGQSSVPAAVTNITAISAGPMQNLAVDATGQVLAWGSAVAGTSNLGNVSAVSCGNEFSVALRRDGTVAAWGQNNSGQTNVPAGLGGVTAISAGGAHSLALIGGAPLTVPSIMRRPPAFWAQPTSMTNAAGANFVWNSPAASAIPVTYQWHFAGEPLPGQTNSSLALTNLSPSMKGNYFVIGLNAYGSVTSAVATLTITGAISIAVNPVDRVAPLGSTVTLFARGGGTGPLAQQWLKDGLALIEDGRIAGVNSTSLVINAASPGDAGAYQFVVTNSFGVVTSSVAYVWTVPVLTWGNIPPAPSTATNVVGIASKYSHTVVLRANGTIVGWGDNDFGQCTSTVTDAVAVAAQAFGTIALRANGTITGFGANTTGELTPPAIATNVVAIAAGLYHGLALTDEGKVISWGASAWSSTFAVPAQLTRAVGIAAGWLHSLAIRPDGTVVGWGSGGGVVPVGATNVIAVAAGNNFSMALRRDGRVVTWGSIANPPAHATNIIAIAGGSDHAIAIRDDGLVITWPPAPPANVYNATAAAAGPQGSAVLLRDPTGPSPFIWRAPSDRLLRTGSTTLLFAGAVGGLPLRYQWYSNGVAIAGANNEWLAVAPQSSAGTNHYHFVASNDFGTETSAVTGVTFQTPPSITMQPRDVVTNRTAQVAFTVSAAGSETLTYRWYFGGAPLTNSIRITGADEPALTISNVQLTDQGSYSVRVTNLVGSLTSVTATLTVPLPPTVTTNPKGRSVPEGLPTTFNASATGYNPISLQWKLNQTNLFGGSNQVLAISAVTERDLGLYSATFSNAGGITSTIEVPLTFGRVSAWGENRFDECLPPPGLSNVTTIAPARDGFFNVATLDDGRLVSWAQDPYGNTLSVWSNVVQVSAAWQGVIALNSDGLVHAFGGNLGLDHGLSNVVSVASGHTYTMALRRDGSVFAGSRGAKFPVPPPWLRDAVAITAGPTNAAALRRNGTVVAWGSGPTTNVPPNATNIAAISAAGDIVAAVRSNGTVVAWGSGIATNLPLNLTNIVAISAGGWIGRTHAMALRRDGTVISWGDNSYSQQQSPAALTNVIAVYAGGSHQVALVEKRRPVLLRAPVGGVAYSGSTFELVCHAGGPGPLFYQWRHNGTNIAAATNETLVLTNVHADLAGTYQVGVSNLSDSVVSLPAAVDVVDGAPRIFGGATNVDAFLGGKATIEFAVVGSAPTFFQWLHEGTEVASATNEVLRLDPTSNTAQGEYQLVATNAFGAATSPPVRLRVHQVAVYSTGPDFAFDLRHSAFTNLTAIAAGYGQTIGLRADGTVVATNSSVTGFQYFSPTGLGSVVEVTAGQGYLVALHKDGRVSVLGGPTLFQQAVEAQSNIVSIMGFDTGCGMLRSDGLVLQATWNGVAPLANMTNALALTRFGSSVAMLRYDGRLILPPPYWTPYGSNIVSVAGDRFGEAIMLLRDGSARDFVLRGKPIPPGLSGVVEVATANELSGPAVLTRTDGTFIALQPMYESVTTNTGSLGKFWRLEGDDTSIVGLALDEPFPPLFLHDALDSTALIVSSRSSPRWYGQTNVSHDGVSAAASARIGNNTASSMRTWVEGPLTARFWWKVSSETNSDLLSVYAGSTLLTNISGEFDWNQCTVEVPPGNHLLIWTYAKDGAGKAGQDRAWVDQLELLQHAPAFTAHPASQTVLGGTNVTFTARAIGTPPIAYQWWKDGSVLSTQNVTTVTLTNLNRAHSGTYWAVASNAASAVASSNAVLSVRVPQRLLPALTRANGQILFSATDADGSGLAAPAASVEIQVSTNLINWAPLPVSINATNGMLWFEDLTNWPARFYRLLEP